MEFVHNCVAKIVDRINADIEKTICETIAKYASEKGDAVSAYFIEKEKADEIIRLGVEEFIKKYPGQGIGNHYEVEP